MASDFCIRHAAHIIKQGGTIAYPTDTVYGLGCDPYNLSAVEKINEIKQRPANKYFILLANNIQLVLPFLQATKQQLQIITNPTEPTSWIVTANSNAPDWLTNRSGTVTIRITQSEIVKKLCIATNAPIISTSANISGRRPAKNGLDLHQLFHNKIDKILLADKSATTKPSKIIRLCDNQVIRE